MTEKQSKTCTKKVAMGDMYGTFGIKTTTGLSAWIDQWLLSGGEPKAFDEYGLVMVINTATTAMAFWPESIFNVGRN